MYTCVDNFMIYPSITLFCVFSCSFCVPEHESKYTEGSASTNLVPLDKMYFQKSHPGLSRQNIFEAQFKQQDYLLDVIDVALVVPNSTLCPYGDSIYRALYMKVLVYTLYKNIYMFFFHPGWLGINT